MKCINAHCQKEIGELLFCPYCGTKQVKPKIFCAYCGAEMDDDAVFCDNCGQKSFFVQQKELEDKKKKALEEAEKKAKEERIEKDVEISKIEKTLHDLVDNPTDVAEKDLEQLPADIEIIVVCAAFATSLATKVAHTLDNKYHMKDAYDNEDIEQMSEYLFDITQSDEETKKEHIK